MLYWFLKRVGLGPWLRLIWRPWVEGLENLPDEGPVILASNHLSFCDSFFLPIAVPRRVTFLAKTEYFTTPGLKGGLSRLFFSGLGQVPIDRADTDAALAALRTGARVLQRGDVLGIYPEGTRSPDGRLYRGKTGVARLALETGVPVIPCAMIDTEKVQPTGRKIPHLRPRPGLRLGPPLDFSRYEGMAGDRYVERSLTDEIMYELMRLSGQEYVDKYAAKVKQASGAVTGFGAGERRVAGSSGTSATSAPGAGTAEAREAVDRRPDRRAG